MSESPNAGYDEWLEAIAAGEGYYLACPNGHGSLPPRRVCPHCGSTDLDEASLPATGTVETYTIVSVPTPQLADDAPYATVIASFGPVRLTGLMWERYVDSIEVGMSVETGVGQTETRGREVLTLRPA